MKVLQENKPHNDYNPKANPQRTKTLFIFLLGGDVAQLVECPTGMPLTSVRMLKIL